MKKIKLLILNCIFISLFAGCAVSIPATDATPPKIRVTITGPGVNIGFNTQAEADRKQINLQHNGVYTIAAIVSDNGGVSRIYLYNPLTPTQATYGEFKDQNHYCPTKPNSKIDITLCGKGFQVKNRLFQNQG